MQNRAIVAVTITATGIVMTSGASSVSATIPNTSAGSLPRFIRVTATSAAYVKVGKTTATAVAGDVMVQPGDAVYLTTSALDTIACLQVAAGGTVCVNPLEDQ